MARVLIIGGGFGGVVAAESLAKRRGNELRNHVIVPEPEISFLPSTGSTCVWRMRAGRHCF